MQDPKEAIAKITLFYSFLNNLIGNRNFSDFAAMIFNSHSKMEISIYDNGTKLTVIYPFEGHQSGHLLSLPSSPNKAISILGHEVINSFHYSLSQITRMIPVEIIKFCSKFCPHIHKITVYSGLWATEFKVYQVSHEDDNDGPIISYSKDEPGMYSDGSLVKVITNGIHLTQSILDQMLRCLPKIKILITAKGVPSPLEPAPLVITHHTNISSLRFSNFKHLNKLALGINLFIPTYAKIGFILIHLVHYDWEKKNGGKNKDDAYYKFFPPENDQQVYSFSQITFDTFQQQQQERDIHVIEMRFYKKLQDFVITDDVRGDYTKIYARFKGGYLQPRQETISHKDLKWLSTTHPN